jgi:hypothetical protein
MIIFLIAACSGQSTVEQTLIAENQGLSTQMADIHSTATVQADRAIVTLEHALTEIKHVDNQHVQLLSTLVGRGTPTQAIGEILPQANVPPLPTQPTAPPPSNTEEPLAQDATSATSAVNVTPTVVSPPRLSNVITAEGVDDAGCAVNPVSTFSTDAVEIYVVALAASLQPGSTLVTSRWRQAGAEVATFDFTPDFTEGCLWFFIDQTDIAFTPGNWSVELEIDGGLVGAPVSFTIVGEVAESTTNP